MPEMTRMDQLTFVQVLFVLFQNPGGKKENSKDLLPAAALQQSPHERAQTLSVTT